MDIKKKNICKIILGLLMVLFMLIIPNISNAAKIPIDQVKKLQVSERGETTLKLKWSKIKNAEGYKVYLYDGKTKSYKHYVTTSSTSATISKLKSATQYQIKVRAYNKEKSKKYYGKYSDVLKTLTSLDQTKNVKMDSQTDKTVTISWKKVKSAKGYNVYIYNDKTKSYEKYGNTTSNKITIKNLSPAKTYKVKVRAYKVVDKVEYTGSKSSAIDVVTKPSKVEGLGVDDRSDSELDLSWKKVKGATGYRVYTYNNKKEQWDFYKEVKKNYVTISDLKSATKYKIRVKAFYTVDKVKYYGRYSESIQEITTPKQVTKLYSSSQTTTSITIKWNKVEKTSGYAIYLYNDATKTYKLYDTTKDNSIKLKNLDTARFYKIYVKAYSENNKKKYYGKKSNIVVQNTLPEKNIRLGMDVSKWQGNIDWKDVKSQGIKFVMMRIGYRGDDAGKIYEDAKFEDNIKGAVNAGIEVGVYFYSYAITEKEATEEAKWIINKLKEYKVEKKCKYITFDFEDYNRNRAKGVSKEQISKNAIAFLKYVQDKGYTPILYGNKNYLTNIWDTDTILSKVKKCKVWLAQYNMEVTYDGKYDMWQYTDTGNIKGISGNVDLDIIYF